MAQSLPFYIPHPFFVCFPQNLWFANPGGSNSMPSRSHSSVQRTRSLPVHTSPQTMLMFQQPGGYQTLVFSLTHSSARRGEALKGAEPGIFDTSRFTGLIEPETSPEGF